MTRIHQSRGEIKKEFVPGAPFTFIQVYLFAFIWWVLLWRRTLRSFVKGKQGQPACLLLSEILSVRHAKESAAHWFHGYRPRWMTHWKSLFSYSHHGGQLRVKNRPSSYHAAICPVYLGSSQQKASNLTTVNTYTVPTNTKPCIWLCLHRISHGVNGIFLPI